MFDCTDLIKFEMRMGGTIWFVVCDYPFLMTLMYHVAILKTFLVFFQYFFSMLYFIHSQQRSDMEEAEQLFTNQILEFTVKFE